MEILTYKKVYQLVGDSASGTNECITKSAAVEIAQAHRKNVTSNLSQYLNNEYIDVFAVEDKPDLSTFSFANNRYNPQAAGNTYTTSVSSRDIDGNTITYDATSDVDWITDIVISGTEIEFKVNANIGDQRTGHINGSNATGKSDTITIIQEAKAADIDYTYSLVATCTSVPTVTINGTSITRYTTSGNTYTFQYITRVRTESEAPEFVDFTISGGGDGVSYDEGSISVSPESWDLNDGLSKQFTVDYSRVKTTKVWDHSSGTIARDSSTNVELNATTETEHPNIEYTIGDSHPSGQSFSHYKNGMQFTSAASSVDCTGQIFVQYNRLTAMINVIYNRPEEVFTYKYFIKVGYKLDDLLKDRIQLVWQNDQYSQSSKKTFYIKSFKCKINERGETVATEQTEYSLRHNSSGSDSFSISNHNITTGLGYVDCFPIEENTSYQSQKSIGFQVYNVEDGTVFCHINLIQEKKGIQIVSGDAVMFTYNWDNGTDLDQATFVNLNLPASNDHNYAGWYGSIIPEYKNILYFAGDNIGTGNEYSFIDFKHISKYLSEHGNEQSSIEGKTILESLTDDNGVIKIQCDLYTNWYRTKNEENITLSYSVYNKDSENASVTTQNKQFVLNGYTKIKEGSDQALCYANSYANASAINAIVKKGYTLSAKFTYYFNSGVFAFETNKDNIEKWNRGYILSNISKDPSCSDLQFTNDGENVNLSFSLDSINEPDYFDKESEIRFGGYVYSTDGTYLASFGFFDTAINELPYKVNASVPLSKIIGNIDFGENQSIEIYPAIKNFSYIVNYDHNQALDVTDKKFQNNIITIQKPSTE